MATDPLTLTRDQFRALIHDALAGSGVSLGARERLEAFAESATRCVVGAMGRYYYDPQADPCDACPAVQARVWPPCWDVEAGRPLPGYANFAQHLDAIARDQLGVGLTAVVEVADDPVAGQGGK